MTNKTQKYLHIVKFNPEVQWLGFWTLNYQLMSEVYHSLKSVKHHPLSFLFNV